VVRAWDDFGAAVELANQDAPEITWQQAIDRLVKGQAAFSLMGDWAAGYMSGALKLVPGTGFGWAPSPGTSGVFMASSDTFGLPRGQKNRASVLKWLVLISSREGEDIFNPPAGSISPRLDSDLSLYGAYSQSAARDWRRDAIVGSLVQGTAAPESFTSQFPDALGVYLSTRDSRAAANAAQAIADQVGLGK
jgi:glucose/mannose transport system substrate-binding protein